MSGSKDLALAYILRELYWDPEKEDWDPDRGRVWNGFDELLDVHYILSDHKLIPVGGDPAPPEFP